MHSTYPWLSIPRDKPAEIACDAKVRWPAAPAPALRAHLHTLTECFARCPSVSRKSSWGDREKAHLRDIAAAIELLEKESSE